MKAGDLARGDNSSLDTRFMQIGVAFSLLSLVCNHPHFMISYQFGYGRGFRFIRQNWFALIFVPVFLVTVFAFAYFSAGLATEDSAIATALFRFPNAAFEYFGAGFRFGAQRGLGDEIMSGTVWLMYLTVGWHYSKQVFGCMMVYSRYDGYPIQAFQRLLLKGSVFSIALLQFSYLYRSQAARGLDLGVPSTQLTPLDLPQWLYSVSIVLSSIFFVGTLLFVFGKNFRETGKRPSPNLLIPWIALHVWWLPFFQIPEFTFLMVPFFHSLQYMPFAYRVGTPSFARDRWYYSKITAHAVGILVIGFIAFEGLPSSLDHLFTNIGGNQPTFFITAFAVFINVHHFFIDSVTWKLKDGNLRAALFEERSAPLAAVVLENGVQSERQISAG